MFPIAMDNAKHSFYSQTDMQHASHGPWHITVEDSIIIILCEIYNVSQSDL